MASGQSKGDPETHAGNEPHEPPYGDFLLIDLLRPDFRHFFTRYRTDLIGFVVISGIVAFIIVATKWLAMIGADAARQTGAG
jgi:hypothetical protein